MRTKTLFLQCIERTIVDLRCPSGLYDCVAEKNKRGKEEEEEGVESRSSM